MKSRTLSVTHEHIYVPYICSELYEGLHIRHGPLFPVEFYRDYEILYILIPILLKKFFNYYFYL